jgi:hypothetical protein
MGAEDSDDIVSVEFELTPEDWVEVALEHSARSPLTKVAMRNVTVLFGALIVVAALLSLVSGFASGAVLWLLIGGFVLTLLRPLIRSARKKQFGQFAEGGIANGMFGPHRVELRPEGMRDSTGGYEWLTRWSAIEGVTEGEGAFHIYTGRDSFLPIPYTAFPDSESLRRFSDAFYRFQKTDRTLRDADSPGALESPEVDDA